MAGDEQKLTSEKLSFSASTAQVLFKFLGESKFEAQPSAISAPVPRLFIHGLPKCSIFIAIRIQQSRVEINSEFSPALLPNFGSQAWGV